MTSFHDFTLDDAITRALAEEKYLTPTPIQARTIPTVISGRDVIGIAKPLLTAIKLLPGEFIRADKQRSA